MLSAILSHADVTVPIPVALKLIVTGSSVATVLLGVSVTGIKRYVVPDGILDVVTVFTFAARILKALPATDERTVRDTGSISRKFVLTFPAFIPIAISRAVPVTTILP